ncbi:hypothetical protein JYQ62_29015 [Nostoc sp. UHCC 0702]|nr:hypothetical protein JYQ62_29015 [Nostoc sp. UHCC 0702]
MSSKSNWEQICDQVQERLLKTAPMTVKSAKVLRAELLKCLTSACDDDRLKTKYHEVHGLLKMTESQGKVTITGGQRGTRNFKRDKNIPHFERFDGCWFDFTITVNETCKPAEIIGFDFEIRFVEDNPIKFLRFDLNLPGHNNQEQGMRFHMHPSSDDLMVHSPPMLPIEILHLFLYDLDIPKNPRAS